jgi:hypothetical protein
MQAQEIVQSKTYIILCFSFLSNSSRYSKEADRLFDKVSLISISENYPGFSIFAVPLTDRPILLSFGIELFGVEAK